MLRLSPPTPSQTAASKQATWATPPARTNPGVALAAPIAAQVVAVPLLPSVSTPSSTGSTPSGFKPSMSCSGTSGTWTCPAGSSCDYENGGCIEVPTGSGSSSEAAPVASATVTPSSDTSMSSETFVSTAPADENTSTDAFQAESTSVNSFTATETSQTAASVVVTTSAQPTHTAGAGLMNTNIDGVLGMIVLVAVGRAFSF
ncbi:hypothetical protein MMC17_005440 [Xylographa soralifera]|nr:hypothetical protein [Xylographa soralifera]